MRMRKVRIASWSHVLPTQTTLVAADQNAPQQIKAFDHPFIPRGAGRSYGDAAYTSEGISLTSENLTAISNLDTTRGSIVCGAGVRIDDLFNAVDGTDWTFATGGGTRWTTVGGCIGSDVHGKNDVAHGSFGNQVESLRIVLASGETVECSETENADLFAATVGGMGLTGFIESATLRLHQEPSNAVESHADVIGSPAEMTDKFLTSNPAFSVAWLDLISPKFRGIYYHADYVEGEARKPRVPITLPLPRVKVFNRPLLRVLNAIRYSLNANKRTRMQPRAFHHPVDTVKHWNQLYGPRGFHEYQFLVAEEHCTASLEEFLRGTERFGIRPFFAVVKKFGRHPRQGMLSFPGPGITIMADFEHAPANQPFFDYFTDYVKELGGRHYLAKDSYLTASQFRNMYPRLDEWRSVVKRYDPENRIQSDLSRRLKMKPW